jgi:hypothetical protein
MDSTSSLWIGFFFPLSPGGSMFKPNFKAMVHGLFCCLLFIYPSFAQSKVIKEGTATVSGRVTLKGEPMSGVMVSLARVDGIRTPSDIDSMPRAKTDGNGQFRITGVPSGRYSISANAPAFVTSDNPMYGRGGRALIINESENIENIDLELKRGGVITGRVTDSNGSPIVEERLEVKKIDKNGNRQPFYFTYTEMYVTDDRGVYRIYGLPEGRYLIAVGYSPADGGPRTPYDRSYPKTYHPDVTSQTEAKPIEVSEGSETTGVDITVGNPGKTYAIRGRIVNADTGQPVVGAQIMAGALSPNGRGVSMWGGYGDRSNQKGEFILQGILPGKYAVAVRWEEGGDYYSEPTICEVVDSDVEGVEVGARVGSIISGMVVIEGTTDPATLLKLPKVQLCVSTRTQGVTNPGRGAIKIGPDGSFRVKGVQPGKVFISPIFFGPSGPMREFTLQRVERNGASQPAGIDVGPGENVSNVRIVLAYSVLSIRGEVKVVGGTPPPNMRFYVRAHPQGGDAAPSQGAELDARGQFIIENLSPGEYELRLSPMFQPNADRPDMQTIRAISQVKQKVVVSGGNQSPVTLVVDLSRREGNR